MSAAGAAGQGPRGVVLQETLGATVPQAPTPDNVYETRKSVDEYMLMHHSAPEDVMPWAGGPVAGLDFAVTRKSGTIPAIAEEAEQMVDHILAHRRQV